MAAPLFERLLATSVHSALLIAAVWLLCRHVRISPATQCWLWWLIALQALVGLVASPIELAWLPHEIGGGTFATTDPPPLQAASAPGIAGTQGVTADRHLYWQTALLALWGSGVVYMSILTLRGWMRTRALIRLSSLCLDQETLDALSAVADMRGLSVVPRLRLSSEIDSPVLLAGMLRPVLLPSACCFSRCELEMLFAHELAHLQRRDFWWGLVPSVARDLFFFHPLMHLAVREYATAREAACDRAVVNTGHCAPNSYASLLVRLGTFPQRRGMAAASPTFRSLSRRLTLLQRESYLSLAASLCIATAIAAAAIPFRVVTAAESPQPRTANAASNSGTAAPLGNQCLSPEQRHLRELSARRADAQRVVSEIFGKPPFAMDVPPPERARRKAATDAFERANELLKMELEAERQRQAARTQAWRDANPNWRQELEKHRIDLEKMFAEAERLNRESRESALADPGRAVAHHARMREELEKRLTDLRLACPQDPPNQFLLKQIEEYSRRGPTSAGG